MSNFQIEVSITEKTKKERAMSKINAEIRRNQREVMKAIEGMVINNAVEKKLIDKAKKESTMIPFNLERALAGDKVTDGWGQEVSQITEFTINDKAHVYGVISGAVKPFYHQYLFMAPKKLSGFIDVYKNGAVVFRQHKNAASSNEQARVLCIDLSQHEEGEGI
ncbi:hypothetical protein JLT2_8 [Paraglaciecola Antarctic JLT virus 2]|nr:hypothetical protein JLT2_8 [Paraglaciecola Antarctic JLT virus 2]